MKMESITVPIHVHVKTSRETDLTCAFCFNPATTSEIGSFAGSTEEGYRVDYAPLCTWHEHIALIGGDPKTPGLGDQACIDASQESLRVMLEYQAAGGKIEDLFDSKTPD